MPDFRFVCSQAAQYRVDRRPVTPACSTSIKEKVAAGQWIPVGGMWVEPDMNLPSRRVDRAPARPRPAVLRAVVRPALHRGVDPRRVRLPRLAPADLRRAAVCSRFVTQKLSWNKQNVLPHHTFWWEGIDGTRVLTHFPPVDTYNAEMVPASRCAFASANFHEHALERLVAHAVRLRQRRRRADAGDGRTGAADGRPRRLPAVELGTVDGFFERGRGRDRRGRRRSRCGWASCTSRCTAARTTSQVGTKLGNRRVRAAAPRGRALVGERRRDRRRRAVASELDALWKDVLLHQFHDILPGSSIAWVHAGGRGRARHGSRERLDELIA